MFSEIWLFVMTANIICQFVFCIIAVPSMTDVAKAKTIVKGTRISLALTALAFIIFILVGDKL